MSITLPLMLFIIVGFLASLILFFIGIIRGLFKKGWRLVGYSVLLFIIIVIVYTLTQSFYMKNVRPSVIKNLQENVLPSPSI